MTLTSKIESYIIHFDSTREIQLNRKEVIEDRYVVKLSAPFDGGTRPGYKGPAFVAGFCKRKVLLNGGFVLVNPCIQKFGPHL